MMHLELPSSFPLAASSSALSSALSARPAARWILSLSAPPRRPASTARQLIRTH